jgi:hypothetical protein
MLAPFGAGTRPAGYFLQAHPKHYIDKPQAQGLFLLARTLSGAGKEWPTPIPKKYTKTTMIMNAFSCLKLGVVFLPNLRYQVCDRENDHSRFMEQNNAKT